MKTILKAIFLLVALTTIVGCGQSEFEGDSSSTNASAPNDQSIQASEPVLLDCELEVGYGPVQIYIDEAQKYVLYNAQFRTSYERLREYSVSGGTAEKLSVDEGIDIIDNTARFIQASNKNHNFLFIKEDATFAYAWTTLYLAADELMAFGNNHSGKCSINPFKMPEK